jgi:hypothetical protein
MKGVKIMLVDNEVKPTTGRSAAFIIIIIVVIVGALLLGSNDLDDANCKEWGVEVDDNGKLSWAPIPYTPRNKDDAEHIARQLQGQDIEGGRYYTAKCKEYK